MRDWDADAAWADGVRAYARKQARIRRDQASVWSAQFSDARAAGRVFKNDHTMEGICTAPYVAMPMSKKHRKRLARKEKAAALILPD